MKFDRQVDFVGGAGIVAKHMKKAKADVTFTTVLGNDPLKDFVLKDLESYGIPCNAVIDPTRPTTQKNLFLAGGYRMLKVDSVDNRSISEKIANSFSSYIGGTEADAVVFSDFRHGVFSASTIPELTKAIPAGPLRVADSQVATRWGNILDFQGFDLITPNEREARFALGDQDSIIRPLALELYKRAKCKYLILKLGERGVITYREPSHEVRSFFTMDSFAEHLVDAVGAGDALLAYSTLALTVAKCPIIASILGSVAAAMACEADGNEPIDPQDLLDRLDRLEKQTLMSPVPELARRAIRQ
jgi:bifunctional ADP-heptose synthase (sugar kinase/adenylyltransferase)